MRINLCIRMPISIYSFILYIISTFYFLPNIFLQVPIYARAQDVAHLLDLKKAGATDAILENAEVH